MAYRADIEIAVRGGRELSAVSKQIAALGKGIADVNKAAKLQAAIPASINNYQAAVKQADAAVRQSAAGTRLQKQAIDVYVKSLYQAEQAEKQLTLAIAKRQKELNISTTKSTGRGGVGKAIGGSLSSAAIGGAFPLLFGQSPQAAVGGAIGGLLGGAGGGFAGSLLGTALGELEAAKARTKELTLELGLSSTQAKTLATAFELAGRNSQQLEAAVTNIQGLGLSTQETASAIKIAVELSKEYGGSVEKIAQSFADTLESGKVSISTLNKFTAQGIPIQDELAAKFGVSRTKLLEMAKDGQISVQQVTDALVKMGQEAEKTADKGKTGFDRFTAAVQGIASAIASAAGALLKTLIPALDVVLTRLSNIITRATQAINLITDAQVGEASAALAKSGFSRGTLFANKGNIDDLTQGLKSLQPLSAKTKEQFDRIADVAQRYRVELQQYGGALGEYAVGTAQVELTRVTKDLDTARKAVGAVARPDAITGINAPANLPPSGGGGGGAKGPKPPEDRTAQLREEFNAIVAIGQAEDKIRDLLFDGREILAAEVELQKQIADIERDRNKALMNANYESERVVITKIAEARIVDAQLKQQDKIREINQKRFEQELQIQAAVRSSVQAFTDMRTEQELQVQYSKTYYRLIAEGILPAEADRIANFEKTVATQLKAVDTQLLITNAAIIEAQARGANTVELQKELDLLEQKRKAIEGEAETGPGAAAPEATPVDRITEKVGKLKEEIAALTNIGNIAITVADGIGNAFAQSFQGLITGAMSAKEALGTFFKSVGDMFVQMATEIIAKQITMIILQTILKALGGGFGGGGGGGLSSAFSSSGPTFNPGAFSMPALAADGATFANGIAKFANGGVVSSPTMFKFADGGAMRTGLMGEAGPEAIMPLKRGPDGSLGVQANGLRDAMDRDRSGTNNGAPVLNMSFQSTNIAGVEYVSRDQLEQAMFETRRQASRDGAKRGMSMTLDKLQQSPSTRRRVGI